MEGLFQLAIIVAVLSSQADLADLAPTGHKAKGPACRTILKV